MSSPIDNELAPGDEGARLPSLGAPTLDTIWLSRVKEIIEVLLGRRGGSQWDRAVTFRDLAKLGIAVDVQSGFGGALAGPGAVVIPGGLPQYEAIEFDERLRRSAAYRELRRGIGSAEDLATLPEQLAAQISTALIQLARERGAAIQTIQQKVQTANLSMASQLVEITAAIDQSAAGVRQFDAAYADATRAVATSIKQVTARLDNVGGVTIEEKFLAQAGINSGLLGQWSIKIQTGTDNNPIIAGIGLSVEGPNENDTTSSLVFLADEFGFFTQNGTQMPFGIDGATGRVYVNGQLYVGAGGYTLNQLAAGLRLLEITSTSQIFQITKAGTNSPDSITLKANATNLAGTPNWTIPSGTATLSAGADAYTKVLTFANMATDTVTIQVAQDGLVDTITIVKVREGNDAITGLLTNEAANVSATSAGVVSSFANAGGTFKLYDGLVDKTGQAGVVYSVLSASAGLTISINSSGVYSVTALSNDMGNATLRAVYRNVTIDKQYNIAKSKAGSTGSTGNTGASGQRGTVDIAAPGYTGTWSDTQAAQAISNAGYAPVIERDRVTLYNETSSETRFKSGSTWIPLTAYINGNLLVDGTLSASKIRGGEISGVTMNIAGNFIVPSSGVSQLYTARLTRCIGSNGDAPGIPAFDSTSSGAGAAVRVNGGSSGNALQINGGSNGIVQSAGGSNFLQSIIPTVDNSYSLGAISGGTTLRWAQIYAASATIITSDERTKVDVVDSDLGLEFINALRPVRYRMLVAENIVTDLPEVEVEGPMPPADPDYVGPLEPRKQLQQRAGARNHYGLLAQDVRQALTDCGIDDAALWVQGDPNDPESLQGLRYEELVAPLVRAVQQISNRMDAQQREIDQLKALLLPG